VTPTPTKTASSRPTPQVLDKRAAAAVDAKAETQGLRIEYVDVDADLATQWLGKNNNNRGLRKRRVVEFRRDMLAGKWHDIGDPIRFDTNGELRDGQHRLEAVVLAAATQPDIKVRFVVAWGMNPEAHVVIDTGSRRTAADQLRIAGYGNYAVLAAAAKWSIMYERNVLNSGDGMLKSVTHAEVMDYVDARPRIQEVSNVVGAGLGRRIDMPNGYIACGYYLTSEINADESDEFFHRFADGIGLYEGDPILALRNRMREVQRNRGNLSGETHLSALFRTWNAKREGRSMRTLPLQKDNVALAVPRLI
jgi:hypothetical protein